MKNYRKLNNIIGWIVFFLAAFIYCSTIEPTASFWDCGEYISTAYKLEVGHPPGAPLFQMIGRVFTFMAGNDVTQVAKMVNLMSALCSAFTILFLFWSITYIAKKFISKGEEMTQGHMLAIFGSGFVGAMAYAFTDSFWFSAVEGEVYAMSSFFTAIVFWGILKWDAEEEEAHSNRWLVLIAYLVGLSIGVHLLNLLAIPAMVFVYYFKRFKTSNLGLLITGMVSVVILGAIQGYIIPGIVSLAAKFELFFVNVMRLPFNSGTVIYFLLLILIVVIGLRYTRKHGFIHWNTGLLAFAVLVIGYSSFFVLVIRSNAKTPLNENDPSDAVKLLSYLNREQYGDWPLTYGPYYNAPIDRANPYKGGSPVYDKDLKNGNYLMVSSGKEGGGYNYNPAMCTIFPRMWSPQHEKDYKVWGNIKGEPVTITNDDGETETLMKPTFGENLTYFFKYQLNWMYFRYFLWNFAGRQNDIQGHGGPLDGNYLSGIKFIDRFNLGPQDNLPSSISENKGYNRFYLLPLILGMIGMIFQINRDWKNALVVFLLFFFTGLAIVVYLNQFPNQPRERDYAFAGSFYAFAFWIGLGVYAIWDLLKKYLSPNLAAVLTTACCTLAVPVIMGKEGWNDHDRSHRYTCRDFAKNYLNSCAPNAILFTNGDNDTFPLWYVQEVENYRTDVRVVNLSLLQTDWYIDQMKRQAYLSAPVPFSLTNDKYGQGKRDVVYIVDKGLKDYFPCRELIDFVASDDQNKKLSQGPGKKALDYIPTNKMRIPVDKAKVKANGTIPSDTPDSLIVSNIDWTLNKNALYKNDLMVLDLLATNNWERPVYFAVTTGSESYMGLEPYFQLEGLAYRLTPIKSKTPEGKERQQMRLNTSIMYKNIMENFFWGGMESPSIYMDENNMRMAVNLRLQMSTLGETLIEEGKKDKALKVMEKCVEVMPERNVAYDGAMYYVLNTWYQAGGGLKCTPVAKRLFDIYERELKFDYALRKEMPSSGILNPARQAISILQGLVQLAEQYKQEELLKNFKARFEALAPQVEAFSYQ
jgi:MFS family permease